MKAMSGHVNTSMVRVNWKGMSIVIPLVWYAIALTVSSPQLNQYIVQENVTYIPINHEEYMEITKDIKCKDPNQILTYVLDPVSNRTHLGCFYEKIVIGRYCPEFNIDESNRTILQPKYSAPCGNLGITPCDFAYNSSESFKMFGCFIVYGGIPSLMQRGQEVENFKKEELILRKLIGSLKITVEERDKKITNQYVVIGVVVTFLILAFILFHKYFMHKNRENIANFSGNQFKERKSNEDDPLNGPFEHTRAKEERQSNENDPLNGPFENIRTAPRSVTHDKVEIEGENDLEDQPPISVN